MKIAEMDIQQRQKECQGLQNRKLLIKTTRMFFAYFWDFRGVSTVNKKLSTTAYTASKLQSVDFLLMDDKKYILDDKISTLSYGHYKLV